MYSTYSLIVQHVHFTDLEVTCLISRRIERETFTVLKYYTSNLKRKKELNTRLILTIYCKIKAAHSDILHEVLPELKKKKKTGRL